MRVSKTIKALDLWRKMLGMLFETGHPWLAFKDPCNLRYTNRHMGTVHSSNLCTEITLHTNDQEIAVCNLGSVNLAAHVGERGLDMARLAKTVGTAMRMLDNVIDYNYYSVPQARKSNLRHRPVGLGIMGFQDALYKLRIPYASEEAVRFADRSMEAVQLPRHPASTDLAEERGRYSSFEGSLWSQGILPIDSIARWRKAAATICRWTAAAPWTGTACASGCRASACATPTAWPSPPRRPSPTSPGSASPSSLPTRTCSSNRTSPANSPW